MKQIMRISDIKKAKIEHDKRVKFGYKIQPSPPIDFETDWKCLNTSRERMNSNLSISTLERSFEQALDSAEGVEIFSVVEDEEKTLWKVILKNLKDSWQKDQKFINAPRNVGFCVGNTVNWERLGIKWLITWRDYNIEEYFHGEMMRASHKIRWKNKYGQVKEQWAVVHGPMETRAKYEQTRGNVVTGRQNDTLEVWIGSNEGKEIDDLKRFNRIKVGTRTWRIQVVDDISNPEIYRFSCVEDFNNEATDNIPELLPGGKEDFAENETKPSINKIRIVGPPRVKERLVQNFYAIDDSTNEKISHLGTWSVTPEGKAKIETDEEDGSLDLIPEKVMGEELEINFVVNEEEDMQNSITVKVVSMFS